MSIYTTIFAYTPYVNDDYVVCSSVFVVLAYSTPPMPPTKARCARVMPNATATAAGYTPLANYTRPKKNTCSFSSVSRLSLSKEREKDR